MILKAGNIQLTQYENVAIDLATDGCASAFKFDIFYDPDNAGHRALLKPGNPATVTIEHEGNLLLTGVIMRPEFSDGATKELVSISGYSKTGVLEDCEIPLDLYPLQTNKLSLKQIAEKLLKPFDLAVSVSASVTADANAKLTQTACDDKQTVRSYLCELANQKNILVSHSAAGALLLTRANTTQVPVYDFGKGMPGIRYGLVFDEQRMHSTISVIKQASKQGKGNAGKATVTNPYVSKYRPKVVRMTSGKDVDAAKAARNMLAQELKEIKLTIEMDRWDVNGTMILPGSIITITNPDLHIYTKAKFLVESVSLRGNRVAETATLTCYLPEVYNNDTPKNIFD